jgi:hypothetical protein
MIRIHLLTSVGRTDTLAPYQSYQCDGGKNKWTQNLQSNFAHSHSVCVCVCESLALSCCEGERKIGFASLQTRVVKFRNQIVKIFETKPQSKTNNVIKINIYYLRNILAVKIFAHFWVFKWFLFEQAKCRKF